MSILNSTRLANDDREMPDAVADRVEVLAPPELRRRLARLARATAQLYANDAN